MINVKYKNLPKSDILTRFIQNKVLHVLKKFKFMKKVFVTVEMENSRSKPGPDVFTVKMNIQNGKEKSFFITKKAKNFHLAFAELVDLLSEKMNRAGDKLRIKKIKQERRNKELYFIDNEGWGNTSS